jgi:hypothetical protein
MIKVMALFRRKNGLTFEEFVEYYEKRHAVLGRQYMTGVVKYQRRFLKSADNPIEGSAVDDFDCLTEVWFESKAAMDTTYARLGEPDIAKIIAADEDNIFEREATRCFIINEEHTNESINVKGAVS